ncbi:hypothetical protein GCM10011514_36470 [Emticicia aquatilis]|uniref:Uncharacterized protein n=1 Tax=Emticicia aquatilis TaxID=1537369 RepID=A0A917DTJ9_9BACT|nr:hypothetical protein [Emticicia aquatilis]GGD69044.1 hypothetical protein GCM10011514_36470 [Emticicia aquatilis]
MIFFRLLAFIFFTSPLFAQPKEIKDFENSFCKEYWKAGDINLDFDKRANLMSKFLSKTGKFIKTHPETINFPLKKMDECITISTSEDKLLRVYSINVQTGGSAQIFSTIIQLKSNNKVLRTTPAKIITPTFIMILIALNLEKQTTT